MWAGVSKDKESADLSARVEQLASRSKENTLAFVKGKPTLLEPFPLNSNTKHPAAALCEVEIRHSQDDSIIKYIYICNVK